MSATSDPSLASALSELSVAGVLVGHRLITPGDEHALLDEEVQSMPASLLAMWRASGAARIVGRELLARLGRAPCAIPRDPSGAPVWPPDIVGSFAHDEEVAVAAIALRRDAGALGVDVEPAQALPADVLELIATESEWPSVRGDPAKGRLLFAAKEAVYKAVYPLDQTILDYRDIEVDVAGRRATVANGRALDLRFCRSRHVVVVATGAA